MKVNFSDSRQNNVAFGYDAALSNRLIKTVRESGISPVVSDRILSLNKLCNETEDIVDFSYPKMGEQDKVSVITLFTQIKLSLADAVEEWFPSLKYSKTESEHYFKESDAADKEWKFELSDLLDFDMESISGNSSLPFEGGNNPISPPKAPAKSGLINEFVPNADSPKGFSSLGGMEDLKANLKNKILDPIMNPEQAKLDEIEYGIKMPRATLLYGPPGCGKTYIAEALAQEAGVPLFKFKIGEQGSIYVNGAAMNIQKSFDEVAERSKEIGKPCIMFLDEIDGLTKSRGESSQSHDLEVMSTVLECVNTARSRGIALIAATNKLNLMDDAVRSRFDNQAFVALPDFKTRVSVLKKCLEGRTKGADLYNSDKDLNEIAEKLDKFSNRTISDIVNEASNLALYDKENARRPITKEDFFKAIEDSAAQKIEIQDEYKSKPNKKTSFPLGFGMPKTPC